MTFNPSAAQSILQILQHVPLPDRDLAIDFGSQRYTAQRIFQADSTADFYFKNGFKKYISLDVNNDNYNIKCDLNEPVSQIGQASLVTNIGTGEHIFDQGSVFSNMHNLCKVGGVMFCHLPFTPWLNHGFYNYNPIMFEAMADINKYTLIGLEIGDRECQMVNLPYDEIVKERGQHLLEKAAKESPRPLFVFAAFQKVYDAAFKKPFQKRYKQDIADASMLQQYE